MESFLDTVDQVRTRISTTTQMKPPWTWTAVHLFSLAAQFPTGVTPTIILTELESEWHQACNRRNTSKFQRAIPNVSSHNHASRLDNSLLTEKTLYELDISGVAALNETTLLLSFVDRRQKTGGEVAVAAEYFEYDDDAAQIYYEQQQNETWKNSRRIDMILHSRFKFLFDGTIPVQVSSENGLYGARFTATTLTKSAISLRIPPQQNADGETTKQNADHDARRHIFLPTDQMIFLHSPLSQPQPQQQPLFASNYFCHSFNDITRDNFAYIGFRILTTVREIIKPEKPSKSTTATAASAATPQSKIILIDPHGARCMLLCSGQYSSVSILLARGDIIGIHFPYIHADCFDDAATPTIKTAAEPTRDAVREIEYGTWTVLVHFGRDKGMSGSFVVDDAAAVGDWTAGGHENLDESDEDDDCDAVDFSWAPEKLLFGEVRAGMKNISLIGIIVHLTPNIPIQKGDSLSDRFGIRLSDRTSTLTTSSGNSAEKHYSGSSNIVDVTLWSEIGLASRHLQIGQTVLIQNLRTTLIGKPDSGNKCYVVGSLDYGTKIYCLSTLLGILASPAMLKYNTLADAFNIVRGGFSCRATIKAWRCTAEFPNLTEYIHDACNRPLESSPTVPQQNANLFCKFCNSTVPAGGAYYSPIFGLDLVDDSVQYATNKNSARYVATAAATSVGGRKNTNSLQVFVHGNIAQKILGIDKKGVGHDGTGNFGSFLRYTDALDGLVGKQYDFHVSVYSERRSSIVCRRVDAVLAV